LALDVLGWVHRSGKLHLTLVLPDGTRSLIPATWTDLKAQKEPVKQAQPTLLASCAQLLQARTVVDALQRRLLAADVLQRPTPQEPSHAATELSRSAGTRRRGTGLERARRRAALEGDNDASEIDRQDSR